MPSDLLATFLYAQLEKMDEIDERRSESFDYYFQSLSPLANNGLLRLPIFSPESYGNRHLFYIILKDNETRNALMDYLRSTGILAVFHYLSLHLSPVGLSLGYEEGQFPVTESISGRLLCLPFFYDLKQEEQNEVVKCIEKFFGF